MAHTTSKLLLGESLINELVVSFHPHTLLCDNFDAVLLSHNPVLHARTKHIELNTHVIREKVIVKRMKIQNVPCSVQVANTFIKLLGTTGFQNLPTKIKLITYIPH